MLSLVGIFVGVVAAQQRIRVRVRIRVEVARRADVRLLDVFARGDNPVDVRPVALLADRARDELHDLLLVLLRNRRVERPSVLQPLADRSERRGEADRVDRAVLAVLLLVLLDAGLEELRLSDDDVAEVVLVRGERGDDDAVDGVLREAVEREAVEELHDGAEHAARDDAVAEPRVAGLDAVRDERDERDAHAPERLRAPAERRRDALHAGQEDAVHGVVEEVERDGRVLVGDLERVGSGARGGGGARRAEADELLDGGDHAVAAQLKPGAHQRGHEASVLRRRSDQRSQRAERLRVGRRVVGLDGGVLPAVVVLRLAEVQQRVVDEAHRRLHALRVLLPLDGGGEQLGEEVLAGQPADEAGVLRRGEQPVEHFGDRGLRDVRDEILDAVVPLQERDHFLVAVGVDEGEDDALRETGVGDLCPVDDLTVGTEYRLFRAAAAFFFFSFALFAISGRGRRRRERFGVRFGARFGLRLEVLWHRLGLKGVAGHKAEELFQQVLALYQCVDDLFGVGREDIHGSVRELETAVCIRVDRRIVGDVAHERLQVFRTGNAEKGGNQIKR